MRERAQRRVRLQGPDAPNVGALGQLGGTGGANKPRWSLLTCQLQTAVGKRAAALGGQTGVVQIDFFICGYQASDSWQERVEPMVSRSSCTADASQAASSQQEREAPPPS